jgi:predicted permease
VVGIAPDSFKGRVAPGIGTDFWVPLSMYPHLRPGQMANGNLLITGRLRPGVTPEQARERIDAVAARFNEQRPDSRSRLELAGVVLDDVVLHPNFDGFVLGLVALLFSAVGLVLLVACVNLAGFLLSRATERRKEMAVRIAMGAGRRDILRQLLVESLLLATLGGALGVVLGLGVSKLLTGIEPPLALPLDLEVGLNLRVLAFTGGVTLVAAVLFGLAPALEATRAPVASTLRDETGADSGRGRTRARGLLVMAQMALSTVLLVGAGLFLRSLQEARSIDPGFDTGPAAVVQVEAWASDLTPEEQESYARALLREVEELPTVYASGATTRMPLDLGTTSTSFDIPGVEPPPDQDRHVIELAYTSPGYFDAIGIGLVEGRLFDATDRDDTGPVALVSRAAAELYWPGESPLGRELHRRGDPDDALTVVGVVEDAKIWSLTESPRPYLYLPASQTSGLGLYQIVARGNEDPMVLAERIREAATELNPRVFVSEVQTMADHLDYVLFLPRMAALVLLSIGLLAVTLACVGLYGMVSYSVARRTREVGIRLALGADRREVVGMVVRGGLALVVVGGALGLVLAVFAGSALERYLIDVRSLDPLALIAVPVLLISTAGVAAWLPARRAAGVNPMEALRSE